MSVPVDFTARRDESHRRRAMRHLEEAENLLRAAGRLWPGDDSEVPLACSVMSNDLRALRVRKERGE